MTDPHAGTDWALIATRPTFFLDLPEIRHARLMWDVVPPERRRVLTAVAKRIDACNNQKRDWLRNRFQIEGDRVVVVNSRKLKSGYCRPGDVLVDDREDNIAEWRAAGGFGILFIGAWVAMCDLILYLPDHPDAVVYFDMDGVLADFDSAYLELVSAATA